MPTYHTNQNYIGGWDAIRDDYDGTPYDHETASTDPVGQGATEREALNDLLDKIEEVK